MSIGALTTTFIPPSSCLARDNIWLVHTTCPDNDGCYYLLQGPPTTTDCLPKDYRYETTAYYSPGLCPAGYTAACSDSTTTNRITETRYTCCPSSFRCQTQKSTMFWPFQISFDCESIFRGTGSIQVTESDRYSTSNRNYTYTKEGAINAFAVQVRFQSTDFVSTTSSPSPTSTLATPASPRSLTNIPSSTSVTIPDTPTPPSIGLNTGAKAGIAISAVLGVVALVALFWLFYRIGKRRTQPYLSHVQEYPGVVPREVQPELAEHYGGETWKPSGVTPAQAAYQGGSATTQYLEDRHELSTHTGRIHEM